MDSSTKCAGCGRPLVEHGEDENGRPKCPNGTGFFIDTSDLVDDHVERPER